MPAGSGSVTETFVASDGPSLVTVRVYVSWSPSGSADLSADFSSRRSATAATVVSAVALSFAGVGSPAEEETVAVLATSPASTARTLMVLVTVAPLATSPSWQVTVPESSVQPASAETNSHAGGQVVGDDGVGGDVRSGVLDGQGVVELLALVDGRGRGLGQRQVGDGGAEEAEVVAARVGAGRQDVIEPARRGRGAGPAGGDGHGDAEGAGLQPAERVAAVAGGGGRGVGRAVAVDVERDGAAVESALAGGARPGVVGVVVHGAGELRAGVLIEADGGRVAGADRDGRRAVGRAVPARRQLDADGVRAGIDGGERVVAVGVGRGGRLAGVEVALAVEVHPDRPALQAGLAGGSGAVAVGIVGDAAGDDRSRRTGRSPRRSRSRRTPA